MRLNSLVTVAYEYILVGRLVNNELLYYLRLYLLLMLHIDQPADPPFNQ